MYVPTTQEYDGTMTVFARAASNPGTLARPLQSLASDLDPDLGILQMGVLHDRLGRSLQDTLAVARVGGIFGVLAVVLATLGLYGAVSYVVSSRTHEVGVRVALGATGNDVVRLFLRQGVKLAVAGLFVGTALTLAAGRAVASFLYGVSANDPMTLTLIGATVLIVALLATAVPAVRASRVDPVTALRRD